MQLESDVCLCYSSDKSEVIVSDLCFWLSKVSLTEKKIKSHHISFIYIAQNQNHIPPTGFTIWKASVDLHSSEEKTCHIERKKKNLNRGQSWRKPHDELQRRDIHADYVAMYRTEQQSFSLHISGTEYWIQGNYIKCMWGVWIQGDRLRRKWRKTLGCCPRLILTLNFCFCLVCIPCRRCFGWACWSECFKCKQVETFFVFF